MRVTPSESDKGIVVRPHDITKSSVDTDMGKNLVAEARKWLGVPYRYGGNTRKGVDCSGMVVAVFRDAASLKLPRSSAEQHKYCRDIPSERLEAGDLVFFRTSSKNKVNHVGIYVGDNKIIHASSSRGVIVSDLGEKYYTRHYFSSGRVEGVTFAATGKSPDKKKKQKTPRAKEPPKAAEETIVTPADGGKEIAVAPEIKEQSARQREVVEMSLDEFVEHENRRRAIADSIAAARLDSIETARQDSIAATAGNQAAADSVSTPALPPVEQQKQPDRRPKQPAAPTATGDTAGVADDIRERVARGFKGAF